MTDTSQPSSASSNDVSGKARTVSYECPGCGASFAAGTSLPASGDVECDYCKKSFRVETIREKAAPVSFAEAAQEEQPGLLREFVEFLLESKAWWITPIVVVLLLVGVLIFLSGTAAAPFIYTLF
ncbi:MAG: DUF5989 family protein [Planctomycetota bacterium]|jgi:DNA-directed RNA polymerase subunit RPC12/RpoP